jgi:hypothetical protein
MGPWTVVNGDSSASDGAASRNLLRPIGLGLTCFLAVVVTLLVSGAPWVVLPAAALVGFGAFLLAVRFGGQGMTMPRSWTSIAVAAVAVVVIVCVVAALAILFER